MQRENEKGRRIARVKIHSDYLIPKAVPSGTGDRNVDLIATEAGGPVQLYTHKVGTVEKDVSSSIGMYHVS